MQYTCSLWIHFQKKKLKSKAKKLVARLQNVCFTNIPYPYRIIWQKCWEKMWNIVWALRLSLLLLFLTQFVKLSTVDVLKELTVNYSTLGLMLFIQFWQSSKYADDDAHNKQWLINRKYDCNRGYHLAHCRWCDTLGNFWICIKSLHFEVETKTFSN